MSTTITVRKAEIAELLAAAFPEYRGRKFKVQVSETIWIDRMGGGGSHQEIIALTYSEGYQWIANQPKVSVMDAPCGVLPIDPRVVYAVHEMFCGQDMGITFHVHPQSLYLPRCITAAANQEEAIPEGSKAANFLPVEPVPAWVTDHYPCSDK